jgi:hypothetical protein
MDSLEQAIRIERRAIDSTPEDHPDLAGLLIHLAASLSDRYDQVHEQKDRLASIDNYLKAYNCQNATPRTRMQAARGAIKLLVEDREFQQAHLLAREALRLLPLGYQHFLSRQDQQHAIAQMASLAAEGFSLILNTKSAFIHGVDYLEQGRGILISYINGRSYVSDLENKHPEVAKEFNRLQYKASVPAPRDSSPGIRQQVFQEQDEAVCGLEQCLSHIRSLPRFHRFLSPAVANNLNENALDGPIVVVNVTSISSDALIVTGRSATVITLQNLRASKIKKYRLWGLDGSLSRWVEKEGVGVRDRGTKLRQFLHYLWLSCVRPILEALDFLQPAGDVVLPHIWWIGTGLASGLPFHAAGIHTKGATENTLRYTISSYTPSIEILRNARYRTGVKPTAQSILLVTMPETPGADPLPGVKAEAAAIQDSISSPHTVELLHQPNAETVLRRLQNFTIAHFACHGSSDVTDPSSSYLALQGQSESVPDPLTVQMISDSRLDGVWLAYLSACSTAENRVPGLEGEPLHPASGFQVAGTGHTVASMWPSNDEICAQVASTFYRELLTNGRVQEGNRGVAAALHTAVVEIREQYPDQPHLWAQYIHLGA